MLISNSSSGHGKVNGDDVLSQHRVGRSFTLHGAMLARVSVPDGDAPRFDRFSLLRMGIIPFRMRLANAALVTKLAAGA
jgi:hypothetical protein